MATSGDRWRHALALGLAAIALSGAAVAAESLWLEPRRLQQRRLTVPFAGLPPEWDGLTILHLSDFHYVPRDRWLRARLTDLAAHTAADPPDLIALTGDFVEWNEDAAAIAPLLGALPARLGRFAVLGNHDYGNAVDPPDRERHSLVNAFSELVGRPLIQYQERPARPNGNCVGGIIRALECAGITVLRNQAVPLADRLPPFWIGGVDEPHQHRADPAAVFAGIPPGDPVLLLAHSPDVLECPLPRSPGLTLAGHTHGGQVRLPFLPPLVTHTRVPLPAYRGLIATANGPMYISSGMGASVPLRCRCPPEVTRLVLRATGPLS
jgi:uncharacterized protein